MYSIKVARSVDSVIPLQYIARYGMSLRNIKSSHIPMVSRKGIPHAACAGVQLEESHFYNYAYSSDEVLEELAAAMAAVKRFECG